MNQNPDSYRQLFPRKASKMIYKLRHNGVHVDLDDPKLQRNLKSDLLHSQSEQVNPKPDLHALPKVKLNRDRNSSKWRIQLTSLA